ncbi:ABC transporter permease [Patescibacteria group bacterium]|nr:ABC transporter permease [Patescibacteria group bacterium]
MNKIKNIIIVSFTLAKVSFRLRIENSYLGVFWYLLNPLILFFVLYLIRQSAFSSQEIESFPLYLIIGIAGFNLFKLATTESINSISDNPDFIKSINQIRPESLVLSAVLQALLAHMFEFVLIIILIMIISSASLIMLLYPLFLLIFILSITGLAFMFAVIGVYVNDLNNIWIILSQMILLITPIFYKLEPDTLLYYANYLNPLFYFIESSRSIIITGSFPGNDIIIGSILLASVLFMIGIIVFKKNKLKLAELL